MPIHTDWKSMVKGMKGTYCKKGDKTKCRPFTDGSKVCLCTKAWSVFFATMRKKGWNEGSPRSKKVSETVFKVAMEETVTELITWYEAEVKKGVPKKDGSGKGVQANKGRGGCPQPKNKNEPSWVSMARKFLASKKGNPKLRTFWQKRLQTWEKKGNNK